MKTIALLMFLTLMSCAKVNYKELETVVKIPKTVSNGFLTLTFANHALLRDFDDELTSFKFEESISLELNTTFKSYTFISLINKPQIKVFINNDYVCSYQFYDKYYNDCLVLTIKKNDVIMFKNIPKSNTITVSAYFIKE
jgi:hypothetical protein